MRPVGLFCEHPLQAVLHAEPRKQIVFTCPRCVQQYAAVRSTEARERLVRVFTGAARDVLEAYREHVMAAHFDELEECGCCGGLHFPEFTGDCREDWERF